MKSEHSNLSTQRAARRSEYRRFDGTPFQQKILFSAMACLMPAAGIAAPQSGVVIAGESTISTPNANTTVIRQNTDHSIINWQSFSIASDEYVQYIQPDTYSISLNRVVGGNPSSILGNLSANGQVYLVNPNGIYFGQGVQVDVSGIVASVLDIDNHDFMSGNFTFNRDPNSSLGSVINDGLIRARNDGYVVLMGDYTKNNGVIQAHMGEVVLASGSKITMDVSGNNLISVAVDESMVSQLAGVENTGEIYADGGRVIMTAKVANDLIGTAVNNEGLIQANAIVEQDGAIFLTASGGDITNSGTLDASAASGSGVDGGGVLVYSDKDITLSSGAVVSARGNGSGAGGVVRVIAENRLDHQSGARIDVTSDQGDGGFVEVSGHGSLSIRGDIDIGQGGDLLIDPATLTITNSANTPSWSTGGGTTDGFVGETFIETQLNANTNVTLVARDTISAAAGTLGGATFAISAAGTGDLSIINGNVGTGGTFSACAMTGVCLPGGGTASVTQGATGNINLGTVTINIGGGLTISAGSTTGTASIGTISAGGNIGINAGGNITLNGAITGGGNVAITGTQLFLSSSMVLDAGTNLSLNADLGAVATPHAFDVTLSANNNVNINNNIFLASNNLTLAADGDGNGFGNVEINGSTTESRTVLTQGLLSVTGENFNINGADFGTTPSVRIGIATALDVQANSINATIGNQVNINAGQVFVGTSGATGTRDVSVAVNATNDVNITATGLSVQGGDIFASQSSYAGFVTARGNATLSAGNNITIAVSGNLSVKGGSADGRASFYSSGSAKAFANASISAGNNVNVTNVGGVMTVAAGPATALMTRVVEGTGSAVGQANAKIDANNITVTSAGSLNISRGGATAQIDGFSSGSYSATASANASLIATQAINLNVIGDINLNGTVSNIASASVNSNDTGNYTVVANSNILVKGGTDVTITTTNGGLSIAGGSASVSSVPTAAAGAHTVVSQASAIAEISATQNVTINLAGTGKNLALTGGNGDASINSYVCNNCSATADASVSVNGNIVSVTVADGGLSILGGSAASASVDASGTALATVKTGSLLDASQDMTLNVSGNVSVQGGVAIANGGNAFNAGVLNSSSATANASIVVGNDLTLDAGGLSVSGGTATATPGAGTNTRIAVASAAAIVNVGGIASIDANAGGVTISKGIETASPAVLPDVITVDSGVAVTVGSLNLTATSTINATSASISVTSDASFDGGVTVAIDAASTLTVGGNLSITGGSSLNVNNANYYSLGGTSLSLIAGNNLSINVGIGSTVSPLVANVNLNAGNNVVVNNDIVLANNSLNLAADFDGNNLGNVTINGSTTESITVKTNGTLTVTGQDFNVNGADFGTLGTSTSQLATVSAEGDNVVVNITGDMLVQGGQVNLDVNIGSSGAGGTTKTVNASAEVAGISSVNITANNLTVQGGVASASVSGSNYSSSVTALANAKVSTSGGNLSLTVTGGINLLAGTANAAVLSTSAFTSDQAVAQANAELTASGNVTINPSGSLTLTSGTSTTTTSINGGTASATANASLSGAALTAMTTGNISLTNAQVALTNAASFSAGASFNFNGGNIVTGGTLDLTVSNNLNVISSGSLIAAGAMNISAGGINDNITATYVAGTSLAVGVGGNYNVLGNYSAGTALSLTAANILDININLGTSGSRLNNDVTLAGQNINIDQDIFLGTNNLTLTGNTAAGTISIQNSTLSKKLTVSTLGLLSVTGNNLTINNSLTGFSGTTFSGVGVSANAIDVVVNGDMVIQAGDFISPGAGTPVSVDTSVSATGNVSVSAQSLNVLAGTVNVTASGGGSPNPVTADASLIAGGDLGVNVTNAFNMAAGSASANASGTDTAIAQANATVSAGTNLSIQAASAAINDGIETTGGTATVAANAVANLSAGTAMSVMATGDITATGADISAAGVFFSAGTSINLLTSNTTVGNGTVAGILGDSLLLSEMSNAAIALPASNNPNAKFESGGTLVTGDFTLTGSNSYLWFSADTITVNSITAPSAPLLVQYSPFTTTNTIGVEDLTSITAQTNYSNLNHFSGLPATTLAIGGAQQTGSISVGNNGALDIGSRNIFFLNTTGNIDSAANIISTGVIASSGVVATLEPVVFINPRLESINVDSSSWWLEESERNRHLVENDTDDSGMCTAL